MSESIIEEVTAQSPVEACKANIEDLQDRSERSGVPIWSRSWRKTDSGLLSGEGQRRVQHFTSGHEPRCWRDSDHIVITSRIGSCGLQGATVQISIGQMMARR